jgi:putative oxidoreductase
MKLGRLILRGALGGVFVGHGTQKLFGWFNGHGLDATAQGFESMGMRPGRLQALAASAAETGGGALMLLGLLTPLASSAITSVMLTAIKRVHFKNGLWNTSGGYEYNVVIIAAALALAEVGPGSPSLDSALGADVHGPGWALAALAGGAAGAAAAHLYSERQPAPPAVPRPEPVPPEPVMEEPAAVAQPTS